MYFVSASVTETINDWCDRPFSYGADCCQFAASVVAAAKGYNPMEGFDYVDEESANQIIAGFGRLEDAITDTVGSPIEMADAQEYDLVLIEMTNGLQMAGVVICGRVVIKDKNGIRDLNPAVAKMAWRT